VEIRNVQVLVNAASKQIYGGYSDKIIRLLQEKSNSGHVGNTNFSIFFIMRQDRRAGED